MANKVIIQNGENGKVDILTKHEGYPADHYLTVDKDEVDEWVTKAGGGEPGVEVVDYRK